MIKPNFCILLPHRRSTTVSLETTPSTIIKDNAKDSKLLFRTVDKLLQKNNDKYYPAAKNDEKLANSFADFFSTKIDNIRNGFINSHLEQYIVPGRTCPSSFSEFQVVTEKDVMDLVTRSKIKACSLDPSPATIMKEYYCELVPVFQNHHKLVFIYWGHAR